VTPAADRVAGEPYANPRPVTAKEVRAVLRAAYEGSPPEPAGQPPSNGNHL
jgi:maleylacetate reductase